MVKKRIEAFSPEILEKLAPFHGGGEMIATCSFEKTTYAALPFKFEAGTPNVGGNIAIGAAIDFMKKVGVENIRNHENELLNYAQKRLLEIDGLKIYAPMGVGILYGKEEILEKLAPFHGGGEMIATCSFEKTTYAALPFKFEAGTPIFVSMQTFNSVSEIAGYSFFSRKVKSS